MPLQSLDDPDALDSLLCSAARGDQTALTHLLDGHRERLRRMVAFRLNSSLASRVDASDVVQDAMIDATRKLVDYERERPLPFYAWLRRLVEERLMRVYREHHRGCRDVDRQRSTRPWADDSTRPLVERLVASETTPGRKLVRDERRQRVCAALDRLTPHFREILVMRYVEDLAFPEIAAILGIGESAAKMRHLRALEQLRPVLREDASGFQQ